MITNNGSDKNHRNFNTKNVLEIDNLSFQYTKSIKVLEDISISFREKELTLIAGPNGSGKTTLIKHFNGLLTPTEGIVRVFGHQVSSKNRREIQKQIGVVFQNPDEQIFFPKVYDDVAFGPRNMHFSSEEVDLRVKAALQDVQIENLVERITFNLSFGEKKRLALAGILAMKPKIIVLDEPTIGIDPWSKPRLIDLIIHLKQNHTVIVISHDFDMMKKADRILLLKKGKIFGDFNLYEDFYNQEFN